GAVVQDVDVHQLLPVELGVFLPEVRDAEPVDVPDARRLRYLERVVQRADLDPLPAQVGAGNRLATQQLLRLDRCSEQPAGALPQAPGDLVDHPRAAVRQPIRAPGRTV